MIWEFWGPFATEGYGQRDDIWWFLDRQRRWVLVGWRGRREGQSLTPSSGGVKYSGGGEPLYPESRVPSLSSKRQVVLPGTGVAQ